MGVWLTQEIIFQCGLLNSKTAADDGNATILDQSGKMFLFRAKSETTIYCYGFVRRQSNAFTMTKIWKILPTFRLGRLDNVPRPGVDPPRSH